MRNLIAPAVITLAATALVSLGGCATQRIASERGVAGNTTGSSARSIATSRALPMPPAAPVRRVAPAPAPRRVAARTSAQVRHPAPPPPPSSELLAGRRATSPEPASRLAPVSREGRVRPAVAAPRTAVSPRATVERPAADRPATERAVAPRPAPRPVSRPAPAPTTWRPGSPYGGIEPASPGGCAGGT